MSDVALNPRGMNYDGTLTTERGQLPMQLPNPNSRARSSQREATSTRGWEGQTEVYKEASVRALSHAALVDSRAAQLKLEVVHGGVFALCAPKCPEFPQGHHDERTCRASSEANNTVYIDNWARGDRTLNAHVEQNRELL